MKKTETERKLALIQSIRMENQYNRLKCREREHILYGNSYNPEKGELYGAEMTAAMPGGLMEEGVLPRRESFLGGFRIRFILAAALTAAFIYMDLNHLDIYGVTADDLMDFITETTQTGLANSFDF